MKLYLPAILVLVLGISVPVQAQEKAKEGHAAMPAVTADGSVPPMITTSPEGAKVYFIGVKDGKTVKGPLKIKFGLSGMGVCPAGFHKENTGHHHLLVNMDVKEIPSMEIPLPAVEGKLLHFGGGQTETTLELPPGEHTLQLILGNWTHVPHNPPVMSEQITITVKE